MSAMGRGARRDPRAGRSACPMPASPATAPAATTACSPPGKGHRPHREQQRLPELPHDPRLAAGALRSPGRHGKLRQLPQRGAGRRQAARTSQTSVDCSACHGTITWTAATFNHLGITAPCSSCHNGITAIGKQIQHVVTTHDCGTCHNTVNWTIVNLPAAPVACRASAVTRKRRPAVPGPRRRDRRSGEVIRPAQCDRALHRAGAAAARNRTLVCGLLGLNGIAPRRQRTPVDADTGRWCSSSIPTSAKITPISRFSSLAPCSMCPTRPPDHGSSTSITLRLGQDCGDRCCYSLPPELPLVGGGGNLVTGARVDSIVPGQATLELTWARDLDFVMAPTASGLGLRVRLIGTAARARARPRRRSRGAGRLRGQSRFFVDQVRPRKPSRRPRPPSRRRRTCPRPTSRTSTGIGCGSARSRPAPKPSACCKLHCRTTRAPGSRSTTNRPDLTAIEHAGVQSAAAERSDRPAAAR